MIFVFVIFINKVIFLIFEGNFLRVIIKIINYGYEEVLKLLNKIILSKILLLYWSNYDVSQLLRLTLFLLLLLWMFLVIHYIFLLFLPPPLLPCISGFSIESRNFLPIWTNPLGGCLTFPYFLYDKLVTDGKKRFVKLLTSS